MPLPQSSLSIICTAIGDFVRTELNAAANNISVSLGAPSTVADDTTQHRVNLFFYRFEPGGGQTSVLPNQQWLMRLFCLVTTFGIDEDDISAGENDLRMLGEVIRVFHQQPVLTNVSLGDSQVRLQTVFMPLSDEQINQVWSTQGDTVYRASVIYEMALAPIIPAETYVPPPLVGALGQQTLTTKGRYASFSGAVAPPLVNPVAVDIDNPTWQPQLCWVYEGECAQSLSFDADSVAYAAFVPHLWVAGDSASTVNLQWQIWDRQAGWRDAGASQTVTPFSREIDPDDIPPGAPGVFPQAVTTPIPVEIPSGEQAAQGVLYATREVVLAGQPPITVRSNPLLLSLYRSV